MHGQQATTPGGGPGNPLGTGPGAAARHFVGPVTRRESPPPTRDTAARAVGWTVIANGLVGVLFAEVAQLPGSALEAAVGLLAWDLLTGVGLLRRDGFLGISSRLWRGLAIVRLAVGALVLYRAGGAAAHHVRDLRLLEAAPAALGLACLLAILPRSRTLIGTSIALWAVTPILTLLQLARYEPLVRATRVAQVRDVALENRDYSDPRSGFAVALPSDWYLLRPDDPFPGGTPSKGIVIACPRAALLGSIGEEFVRGSALSSERDPASQYLDRLVADRVREFPRTRVVAREALPGPDVPAEQLVMATTGRSGEGVVGFAAAFDDGYRFHWLTAFGPKAEQDEAYRAFAELLDGVRFGKTPEERERDAVASMTQDPPSGADEALTAFARYIVRHRLSVDEAQSLGGRLAVTIVDRLSASESEELVRSPGLALLAVPEERIGTLSHEGAVGRVTDDATAARERVTDADWVVRRDAVWRLADQADLVRLATRDPDSHVRSAAARRVTDQAALATIATSSDMREVREGAILRLDDQAVLARLAAADPDGLIRMYAASRVTDQTLLGTLATGDPEWTVRTSAAGRLTDQALLARILNGEPEARVREAAVRAVTDQTVLAAVATRDPDFFVRIAAVRALTDRAALARVAKKDPAEGIRITARNRLIELGR